MKAPSDNIKLDNHIRDLLKNPDAPVPTVDWSEVEVLLRHEAKSISLPSISLPDKKYLVIGAGVVVLAVVIFLLSRISLSAPDASEAPATAGDTTISLMPSADSAAPAASHSATPVVPPPAAVQDTAENQEPKALQDELRIADSLLGIEDAPAPPAPKKEKKSKLSGLAPTITDTGPEPENILPPESKPEEIKSEAPVVPADTSKTPASKKNKKGKKPKVTADSSKNGSAPPGSKRDSLK